VMSGRTSRPPFHLLLYADKAALQPPVENQQA
jgi:hypothetical protein